MRKINYLLFGISWSLALFSASLSAASADDDIYVFYPEVSREAHRLLLEQIISGIEDGVDGRVISYPISSAQELEEHRPLIESSEPGTVIMLGPLGRAFKSVSEQHGVIISGGALLTDGDIASGLTGISISPDPGRLFEQLLSFKPDIQKVTVIYHRETHAWLVDMAEAYAQELGLEFEGIEALNVRDAASYYRRFFSGNGDSGNSLWLLQGDPTLDEKALLPELLVDAWNSNRVVFSSDPSHVNRSALFSLFPDYYEMGSSLAELSRNIIDGEEAQPLAVSDLRKAVNIRTAEHLDIRLSRSEQREFDLIFPSR